MGPSGHGQLLICPPLVGVDGGIGSRMGFDKALQGGAITVVAHL
jgi:hypothetical protein